MWFFDKNKQSNVVLGIDISREYITAVKVRKTKQKYKQKPLPASKDNQNKENFELLNYGILHSNTESIQTDKAIFAEKDVSLMVKDLLHSMGEKKLQATNVVMSIPAHVSFIFNLDLPSIPKNELDEAVRFEARNFIPLAPSEVELNWQVVDNSNNSMKILVIAVPNSIILQYKNMAKRLNFKVKALEIRTFSFIRALDLNSYKGNILFVDIVDNNFNISFMRDGTMNLSHNENFFGGNIDVDKVIEDIKKVISTIEVRIEKVVLFSDNKTGSVIEDRLKEKLGIPIDTNYKWSTINTGKEIQNDFLRKRNRLASALGLAMY